METQIVSITTIAGERIPEPNTQLIKPLRCRVRPQLTADSSRTLLALLKKKKKATEALCATSGQFGAPTGKLSLSQETEMAIFKVRKDCALLSI